MLSKYFCVYFYVLLFNCRFDFVVHLGEKIIPELGDSRKIEIYNYVR